MTVAAKSTKKKIAVKPTSSDDDAPPAEIRMKPHRDPMTGGVVRPLDYKDIVAAVKAKKNSEFTPRPNRFYASDIGHCLYKTWMKRTGVPMDDGSKGFDDGIGERGDAVEAQHLKNLREFYGDDNVLTNVRFTKIVKVGPPENEQEVALVFKSDPVVIGDNFQILQFLEIKSKNTFGWMKTKKLMALYKEGLQKAPLLLAKIDIPDGEGAAQFDNALQGALGFKLARTEAKREPEQGILRYVAPEKHTQYVDIVFSRSDIDVLAEIARRWMEDYYHYFLQNEAPPPLFAMAWECGWCDYKNRCALRCKEEGIERAQHPLAVNVNAFLERGRQLYSQQEEDENLKMARLVVAEAEGEVARLEQEYIDAALEGA